MVEAPCDGAEFICDGDPWVYATGGADESLLDEATEGEVKRSFGFGFKGEPKFDGEGIGALVALVVQEYENSCFEDGIRPELCLRVPKFLLFFGQHSGTISPF